MAKMVSKQFTYIPLITCLIIFIASFAFIIFSGNQLKWADETVYAGIAERLADGHGFVNETLEPSAFRPPGYPYLISLIYQLHESVVVAKLVNAFALAASAWILALIVKNVAPKGEVFAPFLVLIYPLFIFVSGTLYPQIVGGFIFVLALYFLIEYPKTSTYAALSGALLGVLILMIPSFALVFLFITALLLIANRVARIYSIKFVAIFFLATILVVAPWVVRSSLLFDKFVFISTNSGINLLYGNSENTEYDTGVVDVSKYSATEGLNEAELDSYYKNAALNWVVNHPTDALANYFQKAANYFNFKNKLSTKSEESVLKNLILFFSYYPMLIVVLIRCTLWRKYKFSWPELLLYILYFGNAFLSAVVYTRIRYRVPFDFLLVAMVSIFIGHIRSSKLGKVECQTHS